MEKVKLTQEQAEAIKQLKCMGLKEESILLRFVHVKNAGPKEVFGKWSETLSAMDLGTLIKALYIGYEVEETFKVGDWVFRKVDSVTGKVHSINGDFLVDIYPYEIPQVQLTTWYRHATPEEIAEEKQRRWWAKHGREVYEFKSGDLIDHDHYVVEVMEVRSDMLRVEINTTVATITEEYYDLIKVICFAEDRKDLEA